MEGTMFPIPVMVKMRIAKIYASFSPVREADETEIAWRMRRHSQMTFDSPHFLLKQLMPKSRFKLS
jgi:hypothetical protein